MASKKNLTNHIEYTESGGGAGGCFLQIGVEEAYKFDKFCTTCKKCISAHYVSVAVSF